MQEIARIVGLGFIHWRQAWMNPTPPVQTVPVIRLATHSTQCLQQTLNLGAGVVRCRSPQGSGGSFSKILRCTNRRYYFPRPARRRSQKKRKKNFTSLRLALAATQLLACRCRLTCIGNIRSLPNPLDSIFWLLFPVSQALIHQASPSRRLTTCHSHRVSYGLRQDKPSHYSISVSLLS